MGENAAGKHQQGFELSSGDFAPQAPSKCFDDDGRLKRTGTVWTASAHIMITVVIGSGVLLLSLAWATAQLGWIAGPTVLFLFSFVTYYTSCLLAACYRCGDPVTGKRKYTYMEAVQNNLGEVQVKLCGVIQYFNLVGVAIGYTIAASISMIAVKKANCCHEKGLDNPSHVSGTPYMVIFGFVVILFSQIPDFDQISWLSKLAEIMSFTYCIIGLGLGVIKVAENKKIKGSLTSINIGTKTSSGTVTETQKIWRSFQALGELNLFRLVWRTLFVCFTTLVTLLMPFFNDVVGILGALGFWPLMVYFPVEMYIVQKKIPNWSMQWVSLQILSLACLIITICALAGSFAGVASDLKVYHPFKSTY